MEGSMRLVALIAAVFLAGCATAARSDSNLIESSELWDASRERQVPIALYFPAQPRNCTHARPCPVAFVSSGYGLLNTDYSFISNALAKSGYLVVAIQASEMFSGYIIGSPSIWYDKNVMEGVERKFAGNHQDLKDGLNNTH